MNRYKTIAGLAATALLVLGIACSGSSASPDASPTPAAAVNDTERTPTPEPAGTAVQASPTAEAAEATPTSEPEPTPEPTATNPPAPEPTAPPAPTSPPAPTAPPAPTSPPAPAGVAAPIQGYGFPYQLTVAAGSTVVWTNYDAVPHDVSAKDESWSSGLLRQGESWSRTFSTPGKYAYVCRTHPYMQAVLIVQ